MRSFLFRDNEQISAIRFFLHELQTKKIIWFKFSISFNDVTNSNTTYLSLMNRICTNTELKCHSKYKDLYTVECVSVTLLGKSHSLAFPDKLVFVTILPIFMNFELIWLWAGMWHGSDTSYCCAIWIDLKMKAHFMFQFLDWSRHLICSMISCDEAKLKRNLQKQNTFIANVWFTESSSFVPFTAWCSAFDTFIHS